jgi:hypothetical protein
VKTLTLPRASSPQSRASLSSPPQSAAFSTRRLRGGTCGRRTRSWRACLQGGGKRRRRRSAASTWGKIEEGLEELLHRGRHLRARPRRPRCAARHLHVRPRRLRPHTPHSTAVAHSWEANPSTVGS